MTKRTVTFRAGDVVRVPFPFVDSPQSKHRPALVLSNEEFNRKHGHAVLCMITSAAHDRWRSDIVIADLRKAGLKIPSMIRFKVFTLDQRLITGSLGTLGPTDWKAVRAGLSYIFRVEDS